MFRFLPASVSFSRRRRRFLHLSLISGLAEWGRLEEVIGVTVHRKSVQIAEKILALAMSPRFWKMGRHLVSPIYSSLN